MVEPLFVTVNRDTFLFPQPTMDALDARYKQSTPDDALILRTVSELEAFKAWLGTNQGLVGEFGIPAYNNATGDVSRFTHLLDRFYTRADELGINTEQWVAANWSGGTSVHSMGVYNNSVNNGRINNASPAAIVAESHYGYGVANGLLRGVNLSGLDFPEARRTAGTPTFVPTTADIVYLASRGVKSIRLSAMWEHLQPTLNAPLDSARLTLLNGLLVDCANNNIKVILDLAHNYARYMDTNNVTQVMTVSGGAVNASDLADFWTRVATWVKADGVRSATVHSYDIMNEPHDLAPGSGALASVLYSFEGGTIESFESNNSAIAVSNSSADAYAGTKSLRIAPTAATYAQNFFSIQRSFVGTPTGTIVSARIKAPIAGAGVTLAVQDQSFVQHPGTLVNLVAGQWTEVTAAVTPGTTSITNLVFTFSGITPGSALPFYLDQVGYAGPSTAPASVWEQISQTTVAGIRTMDATRPIIVPTYQYSAMQRVVEFHPAGPWVTGTTNIWYQTHSYWDRQRAGFWKNPDNTPEAYAQSLAAVTTAGTATVTSVAYAATTSTSLIGANSLRRALTLFNNSTAKVYVNLSGGTASATTGASISIAAGQSYTVPAPSTTNAITAFWEAGGAGSMNITEYN